MMNKTILVVDDEKPIRTFVSRNLEARGFEVYTATNGLEALALFNTQAIDLVILDIMMPNMDGIETCRRMRTTSIIPIIILTALGEETDRVQALDAGADDCLTKPFGVEELLARVRAALRRMAWINKQTPQAILRYREIELDSEAIMVTVRGQQLSLTQTEYNLLHFLMQNVGKTLSHDMILKRVWGPEYGNESEYLRVYMGRIRRKIEVEPAKPEYLHTEFGIGYRFGH